MHFACNPVGVLRLLLLVLQDGRTPLHLAAQRGRRWEPVVLRLLDFGLEVDRPDKFGWTALHLSSLFGHSSTCALLAEKGADVHAVTENGCTPLHMACWQHHKRVVAELLGRGASPLRPNKFGETPLYLASDASLVSLLSVFVSKVNQGNMGARGGDCSREADGGEKSAAAAGAVCQQRASTETSGFASVAETHPTRIPPVAFPPSHGAKTGTREAEFVSSADEVPQRREHPQLKQHQQGERWGGRGTDGVRGGWNRERNRPSSSCFPSHSSHFHNSHTHAATRLALPPGLSGRHQHAHHQQLRSVQTKAGTQLRGGWYAPPSVSSQPSSGDELADMSTWVQIPDVHTDAHRGRQWSGRMTQAQRDLSGPGWMMPSSSVDAGGWNVLVSGSSFPPVPHEIEEHGGNRLRRFSMGNENERGNHQTETEQLGVPVGEMRRYTEGA
uniref:Uncharacterized protein n=1 Tax=Chromera velia CCMP2878 TaxID=1169474 RepID=A0A0G4FZQ7_9ALVE|eukprot:Cvel_3917.t1-p1 / transcript=Cvel_3917.t1 / gene=Cvel_3917 / organism=Chromera_velia_CCMP2878 / gene_product=26S proteasome non-ATPase regulatory subunit 10, putative / transcript_product=26S proteasome non-ATPase regulatory subunit 10, putative / location=Cvel_scaffold166:39782-42351(+) / protein_length=442 / sequence_SO=supercontig / SO=protein_coding / is_pseudo=false